MKMVWGSDWMTIQIGCKITCDCGHIFSIEIEGEGYKYDGGAEGTKEIVCPECGKKETMRILTMG